VNLQKDLTFEVNGQEIHLQVHPGEMLVDVLRERLGLTGTKIGCREGECGACTVLLDGQPINSCMVPALRSQGRKVTTIEGLGNSEAPHLLQVAFAEEGAVQCGYCTPGFIMATAALLDHNPEPTEDEIRKALAGNLCRCGTYPRVIKAIQNVSQAMQRIGGSNGATSGN
jgi:carbon-monoxide dehydrogenase small subunit